MRMEKSMFKTIRRQSTGFTLVELLVVITIIGILISLLLPAVQAAREAARRMQCQNNLKQLALALLNYESQWSFFPPSACWSSGAGQWNNAASAQRENWCILILPFLEQQALHDSFDHTKPITDSTNEAARSVSLSVMLCPTDSYNRQPFMGEQGSDTAGYGDNWARGNYGANASLGLPTLTWNGMGAGGPNSEAWGKSWVRGVMGANCSVGISQIKDGTSNTVLVGELRAGITAYDPRGVWALSGACSSAMWAHGGIWGDDFGPNNANAASDDTMNCTQIQTAQGGASALADAGMPCFPYMNDEQTARSMHAGGVNTCFADGSVHWLGDFIDAYPSSTASLSVWDSLMLSADGMPIDASQY